MCVCKYNITVYVRICANRHTEGFLGPSHHYQRYAVESMSAAVCSCKAVRAVMLCEPFCPRHTKDSRFLAVVQDLIIIIITQQMSIQFL